MTRVARWAFAPAPMARIAVLRAVVYAFVVYSVFFLVNYIVPHGYLPAELYKPVAWPRLLGLPAPTPVRVHVLQAVLVAGSLVAMTGHLPRLAGWLVAFAYLDWATIGMSYGKIDHDQLPLLVALFALPTVPRARFGDRSGSEAAGFALRCIQVSAVATYFLAAWAKLRWGGWDWANGAVLAWAMTRRGTFLGKALLEVPWLLVVSQWITLFVEALSPLLLVVRERLMLLGVLFFVCFHAATWATIRIHFLPLVVCLLAFVPLETVPEAVRNVARRVRRPGRGRREPVPAA